MDPSSLVTTDIDDAVKRVETFAGSLVPDPAAAELRTANAELAKLPKLITGLGPGMDSTKKELEKIDTQKGGLTVPVDKRVAELAVTRTVSALSRCNRLLDEQANKMFIITILLNGKVATK